MTHTAASAGRRWTFACLITLLTLITYLPCAKAQSESADTKPTEAKPTEAKPSTPVEPQEYRTFYLVNTMQSAENDAATALRNLLPRAKIYLEASAGAIIIRGSADDLQLAQTIIADIDHPSKTYRLTFTLNQTGSANPALSQHVAMVIEVGGKSAVKQGSKVPVVTGSFNDETSKANTQVQYEDVGLNIEAWLDTAGNGLRLRTKIEQSSVSEEKSNAGIQDPVFRQEVFDASSNMVEGKPVVLGTIASPNGARKIEIEVVAEPIK